MAFVTAVLLEQGDASLVAVGEGDGNELSSGGGPSMLVLFFVTLGVMLSAVSCLTGCCLGYMFRPMPKPAATEQTPVVRQQTRAKSSRTPETMTTATTFTTFYVTDLGGKVHVDHACTGLRSARRLHAKEPCQICFLRTTPACAPTGSGPSL